MIALPTPNKKFRRVIKVNAMSYANMVKLMLEGTYNCTELAEMTGLHYITVLQYCRELYLAKAAHISAWDKDSRGRDIIKVYKIGVGKDAVRQKKTQAERASIWRAKKRQLTAIHTMASQGEINGHPSKAAARSGHPPHKIRSAEQPDPAASTSRRRT
jgi:hypothetical protein